MAKALEATIEKEHENNAGNSIVLHAQVTLNEARRLYDLREAQRLVAIIGRLNLSERIESMILEAKAKGVFMRIFDVRYATAGIPVLGEDHVYFPANSYEVLETGNLQGPSQSVQKLKHGKCLPFHSILLVELCDKNKD